MKRSGLVEATEDGARIEADGSPGAGRGGSRPGLRRRDRCGDGSRFTRRRRGQFLTEHHEPKRNDNQTPGALVLEGPNAALDYRETSMISDCS